MADYFKSVTLSPTNYSKIISYFLVSVLFILLHFYLFGKNWKRLWSLTNEAEILIKKTHKRKFPVVTYWFPFAVPLFDGVITLLRIYKNGIAILDECQNKFGKIYWLPIGSHKFLVINDVNMVQVHKFYLNLFFPFNLWILSEIIIFYLYSSEFTKLKESSSFEQSK